MKPSNKLGATPTLLAIFPQVAWASGGALPPLIHDIGVSLLLAGALAVAFHRVRIPPIAAFLVAGFVAGPSGAHFVQDMESIPVIAELGLILLLFSIGLELNLRKLRASGRVILLSGALQYPLSVAAGLGLGKLLLLLGFATLGSGFVPLYIGIVVASSSTLLVVKLFQESFQLDTTAGRAALGLLIFQDLWSIGVIALQPSFAQPQAGPILGAFLGILILVAFAIAASRSLVPIALRWVSTSPELLLVAAVSWCFGLVLLGGNLDTIAQLLTGEPYHLAVGAGMSALIAGACIASLTYSSDVLGKVDVVKDFFNTLFFIGLGMSIPVPESPQVLLLALAVAAVVILVRYVVFFPLLCLAGLDRRNAFVASTRLAQMSELSLVIVYIGTGLGHVDSLIKSAVILAFVLTALITPVLFRRADDLYTLAAPLLDRLARRTPLPTSEEAPESYSLAVLGFHRLASSLLHEFEREMPELLHRVLVVDFNAHLHEAIAALGPTTRYGDLANPETLHHAGIDRARVVLIAVQDDVLKGTDNYQLVRQIRHINPDAIIIANAILFSESARLYQAGADYVYMSRIEGAQQLMEPIAAALRGTLTRYRQEREERDGKWSERKEVLP
jgi:Kef-type K+ transport system membrane component KefB